jgi:hypothetical protein
VQVDAAVLVDEVREFRELGFGEIGVGGLDHVSVMDFSGVAMGGTQVM